MTNVLTWQCRGKNLNLWRISGFVGPLEDLNMIEARGFCIFLLALKKQKRKFLTYRAQYVSTNILALQFNFHALLSSMLGRCCKGMQTEKIWKSDLSDWWFEVSCADCSVLFQRIWDDNFSKIIDVLTNSRPPQKLRWLRYWRTEVSVLGLFQEST